MSEITMSEKALEIKERYRRGFANDNHLMRYRNLGVITEAEYAEIYALKHPAEETE